MTQSASEQTKLEADIPALRASIESLYGLTDDGDMLLIDCVPDLMDALDELERLRAERDALVHQNFALIDEAALAANLLRAERPGWREALEELIAARDMLGRAHSSGTQSGIERAEKRMFRAWDDGRAALHPSVAEGREEDNSSPAKSWPV